MPTLLAVFDQPEDLAHAARRLRGRGYGDVEVFSPVPSEEIDEAVDVKPSRVRGYTLVGGLAGVATGYLMTIWMAYDWPIIVGGKPVASIPPYTVIAFELTILFAGLLTLVGLLRVAGLPRFRAAPHYSERFSAEEFGLVVQCPARDVGEVDGLLRAHAAKEVNLVEP